MPPVPSKKGHWTGYYIQVYFKGDTEEHTLGILDNEFSFSTPGFTWPNTLPFPDCLASADGDCEPYLV